MATWVSYDHKHFPKTCVPANFCMLLLVIQPFRQNRGNPLATMWGKHCRAISCPVVAYCAVQLLILSERTVVQQYKRMWGILALVRRC